MAFYGTPNGIQFSILVVEDDQILGEILMRGLKDNNLQGLLINDGEEAIDYLADHSPHLLILDLHLPKKDGFEVLEWIRHDSSKKQLPVIILTNIDRKEDIERAEKLGVQGYIVKVLSTTNKIIQQIIDVLHKTYL